VTQKLPPGAQITALLAAWGDGDRQAFDALLPVVHDQLKRLARRHMAQERSDHTLQPTALVNEAYLRLARENRIEWQNRDHFFAIAAQIMRFILVDHARQRAAQRRGGANRAVVIETGFEVADSKAAGVLAVNDALTDLGRVDERKARVAEMRVFGGMSVDESAKALGISAVTVMRDWRFARAWLQRELAR
jgi:RNA polymerase sigma factor (TIGR02999 family)